VSRTGTRARTYPSRNGRESVYVVTGVEPDEREQLRRLAAERGVSMAALVRDNIRRELYLASRRGVT
jgi:hypothetical protein